jgi:hypothetical protein
MWFNLTIDLRQKFTQIDDFICVDKLVSKNKALSFQSYYSSPLCIFDFELAITTKQHHPGIRLVVAILGLTAIIEFSDKRHWNHDENRYWNYNEPEGY